MSASDTPIVITMGDPAGIGPEITIKTLTEGRQTGPVAVIGSFAVMQAAASALGQQGALRRISRVEDAATCGGAIPVLDAGSLGKASLGEGSLDTAPPLGVVSAAAGQAAYDAICHAIDLAKAGRAAGIVTAPIHKEALAAAGIPYPGHTEMLADRGGAGQVAMMLANDEIRTVLVTIHVALRDAIEQADFAAQMAAIRLASEGCRALGIAQPRVAVAGLNPHAGEGGLFGREEIEVIRPAIEAARAEGIDASGPWPGDTVFMQARKGAFDVVVAQYHDQGLIPVKYMGLEKGVNITLGLPFVRTSPDHGTAFDIAGRGIADPASLQTALRYARQLVAARTPQEA